MDCRTSADLIARSLSGNASAQDEAQLRGHVSSCPACADLQRGLSATWALMGRIPVLSSKASAPARPAAVRRPLWAVVAAAAALFVVAAIAYSLRHGPAPEPPQAPVAKQEPAPAPREERRETAVVPETPAPLAPEKPQAPAPALPAPAVPETKTAAAPEAPAPKPAAPEAPERRDPLVVKPALPETRPEEKPAPPAVLPAPAALPVVATINKIDGDAFATAPGGARVAVKAGQKLTANESLETGAKGSSAELLFDDGTRVVLDADSLADSFQAAGGKRLTLKRGQLSAQIAKQPAAEPMIFATATAEARVLGTRLSLSVTPTSTRLEVREGKVRLTRKDDNASVDVGAEHFAVAGKGLSMTPKPAAVRAALRETFDRKGGAWQQGGDTSLGIRLAIENGSLSLKASQKPPQDLGGGKMPTDAAELARKAVQGVNSVASLARKDWPRTAWMETRQSFGFSNEAPLRIRTRAWNSHHDPDRLVWIALNHGIAGQGLSL
ncbi:MAG: FecR domain-containing protein [Planctomycetaceae bacterium]|nr:FecR domain-containing protein [Planctomycetaceae bacterium]